MRIIAAIDGEEYSKSPLELALNLAGDKNIELLAIYVMDSGWPDFIGHDWQSSKASRQGFLSYINQAQKEQLEKTQEQFARIKYSLASLQIINGEPGKILQKFAQDQENTGICLSKQVFQACGRPGLKKLAADLLKASKIPLFIFP